MDIDIAIILTYRCNSRCSICNIWKNPTLPEDEISLDVLKKLPEHIYSVNLTGGEPTLRADLAEIVDLLRPRAEKFEVSSNGLHSERIYPIIEKYPDVKIRLSLEGFEELNNSLRGELDGFQKKVEGLRHLQELGGKDLGFATTIQDENAEQLVKLFEFCEQHHYELATSTLHNGFQFHKADNVLYDRARVAGYIEDLITAMLKTNNIKNWFRGYLNLGIAARALGQDRLLPCSAGHDFYFLDPWADVFACNVRPDLKLGNLAKQSWDEIVNGPAAQEVRRKVEECKQNCWMVGSAKTAMRHPRFTRLPRLEPLMWVIENKLRVMFGRKINFDSYINHSGVYHDPEIYRRQPYSSSHPVKRKLQRKEEPHYVEPGGYNNR